MKINGRVHIDLTELSDDLRDIHPLDRAVQEAADSPTGAEVIFHVRRRQRPPYIGMAWLRQHGQHLSSVTIDCDDPTTIRHWCDALRRDPMEGIL